MRVIVDTSMWIEFFNKKESSHGNTVRRLIENDRAVLAGPVLFELLQGARKPNESATLKKALGILPFLEIRKTDWTDAGNLSCALRGKGITIPMTDILIAALAQTNHCRIATMDRHFDHFPELLYAAE